MSSRIQKSLIDLRSLEKSKVDRLFVLADQIAAGKYAPNEGFGKTGALLFFEPSTRTRMSFETACARLGVYPLLLDGKSGSSLEKGESLEDTVLNIDAMNPAFLVVRSGDELDFEALKLKVRAPILNAGWGKQGHPTQALLDAYTIYRRLGACQDKRVLIVGDIRHSRVAASHFELAGLLKYEIALCAPQHFLPTEVPSGVKVFSSLKEGLSWADVAMTLRVQLERHQGAYSLEEYRKDFGFTVENLENLSLEALIMHPGPINKGTEMDSEVLNDPRCKVLEQVTHGVYIRQALILMLLSQEL